MNSKNNERNALIPYVDKVERIYRVLASRKLENITWYRIAKEADVWYSWAHRVLKKLENEKIIKGSEILNPKALFDKWASRNDHRIYREYHIQNPNEVLKSVSMEYALTGYFAENLMGQYLFPRYHEIYIRVSDSIKWHRYLSEMGYVGKGNVQVILADEHVFFEASKVDSWPIVSVQQLIVDLYRNGAECTEAADILVGRVYH